MNLIGLYWKPVLEIGMLWFCVYALLIFIQGTRAVQVLKGVVIIALLFLITERLKLEAINWALTRLLAISLVGIFVVFQPELRRGLARLGEHHFLGVFIKKEQIVDEVVRAAIELSEGKIGALIAIEMEAGLKPYIESGTILDCKISSDLIVSLLTPTAPLHDGGIIIENGRIAAAGCLFPLAQGPHIQKPLGTRHLAAIGLTEETDAIAIVVSEETGAISIAKNGRLTRNLDRETLTRVLKNLMASPKTGPKTA